MFFTRYSVCVCVFGYWVGTQFVRLVQLKICFLGLCFYGVWLRIIMCNWVYSDCIILCICVVIYPPIGSIENLTWVIVFMVFKLTTIIMHSYMA